MHDLNDLYYFAVFDDLDEVIKVIQVVHANSSRVVGAPHDTARGPVPGGIRRTRLDRLSLAGLRIVFEDLRQLPGNRQIARGG